MHVLISENIHGSNKRKGDDGSCWKETLQASNIEHCSHARSAGVWGALWELHFMPVYSYTATENWTHSQLMACHQHLLKGTKIGVNVEASKMAPQGETDDINMFLIWLKCTLSQKIPFKITNNYWQYKIRKRKITQLHSGFTIKKAALT